VTSKLIRALTKGPISKLVAFEADRARLPQQLQPWRSNCSTKVAVSTAQAVSLNSSMTWRRSASVSSEIVLILRRRSATAIRSTVSSWAAMRLTISAV